MLVRVDVGDGDAQQVVRVAGHQVAFEDLRPFPDGALEDVEPVLYLQIEADLDEHGHGAVDGARVHERDVVADDAGFLQRPDAPQARRGREADPPGEPCVRHARVALEVGQDLPVYGVEGVRRVGRHGTGRSGAQQYCA